MNKNRLSVCLVVKNEEKYLPRCLASVKDAANEIIVVDTGSTDNSVEIAEQFTDKVYKIRWRDDFSKARNFALDKASGNWILVLDGDEELDPGCLPALREKLDQEDCEGFLVKIINYYESGHQIEKAPDVVFRLFRNKQGYRYSGAIHEQICDNIMAVNPRAKITVTEDICIYHYGYLTAEVVAKNKTERNTRLLERAVRKNSNNLLDRFHLGVEYLRVGLADKALGEFLFVVDKVNLQAVYAPKLMRHVTQCHYALGNLTEALAFIDNVWANAFRDHGDLYYFRGVICRDLGHYAEAYESLKKCLDLPPQPAHYANMYCHSRDKIYHQLGEIAEYLADEDAALGYYVKTLRENPRLLSSLVRIIRILKPKENPDYTMTALNTVFDLSDPGVQLELGRIFFQEQAYHLAIQCFDYVAAKSLLPEDAHVIKGLCLLRMRQWEQAVGQLGAVPPNSGFFTTCQGNLFLYYWARKMNRKAAACLKNIKNAGTDPARAEVLEILRKGWRVNTEDIQATKEALYTVVGDVLERLVEFAEWESLSDAISCFEDLFKEQLTKLLGDIYFKHKITLCK